MREVLMVLVAAGIVFPPSAKVARGQAPATELSIGALRTHAERSATRIAIDVARRLTDTDVLRAVSSGLFYYSPEVRILTGEEDAFNGIVAKVGGAFLFYDLINVGGVLTPNSKSFHAFPVSVGVESDGRFESVSALGEVGWSPWIQGKLPHPIKATWIGVFLQAGYKFTRADSLGVDGGAVDQSEEAEKDALLRTRATIRFNPRLVGKDDLGVSLVSQADGWYDIANRARYFRLEGRLRLHIATNRYFDLTFERGSGAPNFNKGDQFSANLAVVF